MASKGKFSILPTLAGAAASYMARQYTKSRTSRPRRSLRVRRTSRRRVSYSTKRRRPVIRKRKWTYDSSTAHRELTKVNVRSGRKQRRTLKNVWRTINQATHRQIFGQQNIVSWGGPIGGLVLGHWGANGTAQTYANIRLFSVTGVMNVDNAGIIQSNVSSWYLVANNETDLQTMSWQPQDNFTNYNNQQLTNQTHAYPLAKSTLQWVALKMLLYNPINAPGKYSIELISLKDERLHPVSPTPAGSFSTAFWQYMTKKYSYNPIATGDTSWRKYYKVHKRLVINMDSKDTDQTNNTNYKEVNFFARLNRACDYSWSQEDRMNMVSNDVQVNLARNLTDVHPRKRLYILVRALAQRTETQFNSGVHPSYDFSLKVCHSVME